MDNYTCVLQCFIDSTASKARGGNLEIGGETSLSPQATLPFLSYNGGKLGVAWGRGYDGISRGNPPSL